MPERGVARLAPAKVNLALHVTGRRADGYHVLDTLAVFADIGDRVEVAPADELTPSRLRPFAAHAPGDAAILRWRAAEASSSAHGTVAAARRSALEKNIPAGAGFGGGSADAAAVLARLERAFWTTGLARTSSRAIGLKLGADVPCALSARALRARGIGEDIRAARGWPALPLVLVWPGRAVSTAAVFAALERRDNPPLADPPRGAAPTELAAGSPAAATIWRRRRSASRRRSARRSKRSARRDGCLLARMSGSGSGCFGIYDARRGRTAAAAVDGSAKAPGWWIVATAAR